MVEQSEAPRRGPSIPSGQLFGWGVVAIVNAVWIAAFVPTPITGWRTRLGHHVYDALQLLGLGCIAFGVTAAWLRFGPRRRAHAWLVLSLSAAVVAWAVLDEDTSVLVGKLSRFGPASAWRALLSAGAGGFIVVSALVGVGLRRGYLRLAGVALGVGLAVTNQLVLQHDYPAVHFFIVWGAATLAGVACANPSVALTARVAPWLARAVVALPAAAALIVPPSNAVALQLYRSSGSVVAPLLARLRARSGPQAAWSRSTNPWFNPRDALPAVPSGEARVLGDDAIVILLSVDCLRADLLESDEHIARWPAFKRLRDEAVRFDQAYTVAPSTSQALAALFSSRYYSELYWTPLPKVNKVYVYPHEDPSPRFPELLSAAGVRTVSVQGLPGITVETGLARGFVEESILPVRGDFPGVREQMPVLCERLRARPGGRQFLYAHFADPHAPYTRGGRPGSDRERYLDEVDLVDRGVGELVSFLERERLRARTSIILTADHGEAFGEHDSRAHATTLYGEVLRVPLLIAIPGVAPHVVHERASLVDLGPTLLDLFGLPTPGVYKGQSLVPLLRGRHAELTRPIAAESARHIRAMIFPDGVKVIEDRRMHTIEVFDLTRDPGELKNLYADRTRSAEERVETLRAFFAAHELRRSGYELPFGR